MSSNEMFNDRYSMSPSYKDLVIDFWNTINWYYLNDEKISSKTIVSNSIQSFSFNCFDIFSIIFIAFLFTYIRYAFGSIVSLKTIKRFQLTVPNEKKFCESAWKLLFYTLAWSYCFYLVKYQYNYFDEPYLVWDNWSAGMLVPFNIKIIYFIQCGFYFHSIYATLYLDSRRHDFYIMILHHVVTATLIFVSYAIRYHRIGLLVLCCHDIADIWLELSKTVRYLNTRQNNRWEQASYISFSMLIVCWFIFRLYWFPLKVLYSTGVVAVYRTLDQGLHLYLPFNILLWILFILNIYWFFLILKVLQNALFGSLNQSGDCREDDEEKLSPSNSADLQKKRMN
ncbi:unnamed protein product [Adineta steineri]|uniref:TLC domain-containing protein n=1 Tax=Adineta steineri TaxID=433720 RepID=A0A815DFZ6_9BILA|nr:unnamed protein product [Adineta steineri]CAF1498436.1 unnamed protein product [Adineta steineri]